MTAVSLSVMLNSHNDMKAISLKPAGAAINFRIFAVISQFFTNFGVWIAVTAVLIAIFASAIDADCIAIPAAVLAFAAVYHESEIKKGGDK